MILVVGELRKIDFEEYTVKATGELKKSAVLVVEPKMGRKNIEIFMSNQQQNVGLADWQKLKNKQVSVPVTLFVSFEHKFHKFNLLGAGKPLADTLLKEQS